MMAIKPYLNKSDIRRIFQVSQSKADRIYSVADQIDDKELEWRIEPFKVRLTTVCKVTGINLNTLQKIKASSEG